ncbi:hypothetical protein MMC28_005079 [Mycoblastus sanguinarius]|nr:hypothetical protein [Mycoblastus sanguinarius]
MVMVNKVIVAAIGAQVGRLPQAVPRGRGAVEAVSVIGPVGADGAFVAAGDFDDLDEVVLGGFAAAEVVAVGYDAHSGFGNGVGVGTGDRRWFGCDDGWLRKGKEGRFLYSILSG